MFFNRKKKLAQRMITGVDAIKLTTYQVMISNLEDKYSDEGHDFCGELAGAVVNEIYGCHIPQTQKTFQDNKEIIETELKSLSTTNPDLIQPITDSLRVYIQANQILGSPSMNDIEFTMGSISKINGSRII